MSKKEQAKKSNVSRINDLEFLYGQIINAINSLGQNLAGVSQIMAQYVAVTDILVNKKIITAEEMQEHLNTLQAQMMEELKKEEEAKAKEAIPDDREA